MSFAPQNEQVIGCFVERDFGKFFEFSENENPEFFPGYKHKVWVTDPKNGLDQGWRHALVKKTVAYIVVDENDDGTAVTQKWNIKEKREYSKK